jgi:hypothetical protein
MDHVLSFHFLNVFHLFHLFLLCMYVCMGGYCLVVHVTSGVYLCLRQEFVMFNSRHQWSVVGVLQTM